MPKIRRGELGDRLIVKLVSRSFSYSAESVNQLIQKDLLTVISDVPNC